MYAGWDLVIWALLLVGIVLWNVLQGILRKRRRLGDRIPDEVPEAQQPVPETWGRTPEPEPVPERWGRSPVVEVVPVPREVAEHAAREAARAARERPAPRPGRTRVTRWRSRAEVQRAFVDVAVLGPPRALEPWDDGQEAAAGRGATGR
ncbi:MAG: hypothetical protein AVDCRST_MAG51-3296 [uncultured Ramlibacter sp.]|uniref:Uncharacterized protein n=1 Tax=uncultured Ramlibacter sp. TaxID=260755 RepID=A0A6J4QDS1_9BURK|nr:MAG: hypothetical protein AVDCRST_MAG51-3296 [uncultured Ramlibacter sp.]